MRKNLLSKLPVSRERLEELQTSWEFKRDQFRDSLRYKGFELGSTTLNSVAEFSDRVPVAVIRESAEGIRERAQALHRAGEEAQKPGIEDYDSLNVKKVVASLEGLSRYELEKVQNYEKENKERVTVLREVERLLNPES